MFADSCNFLHNVSVTVAPQAVDSGFSPKSPGTAPSTPQTGPRVIINSPESSRSPTRSPRTTSLLLALRDVIGDPDDEEGVSTSLHPPIISEDEEQGWAESLPTLVNDLGFGQFSQADETILEDIDPAEDDLDDFEGNWTAISDYDEHSPPTSQRGVGQGDDEHAGNESPEDDIVQGPVDLLDDINDPLSVEAAGEITTEEHAAPYTPGELLSPMELTTLHLGPFRRTSNEDSNSFDSGYADGWKPPSPMRGSPPRSPSISSTFDLLSSPFGLHSSRVISPHLGAFMARSPVSPARTMFPSAQEDITPMDLGIDSPQSYFSPQHLSDEYQIHEGFDNAANNRDSGDDYPCPGDNEDDGEPEDLSEDDEPFDHDSYGHTSIWDPAGGPTAVFMGPRDDPVREQVNDAIKRLSRTPTHYLTQNKMEFLEEEAVGSSSLADDTHERTAEEEGFQASSSRHSFSLSEHDESFSPDLDDDTAFLAYLRSPDPPSNENDTLNSLYDIYSDIAPAKDVIADSIRNAGLSPPRPEPRSLSNISTPASSLRERVFTPPPSGRQRSGTVTATADSPASLSSPLTSLDSFSMGRASPFSAPDDSQSVKGERSQSPHGQDIEVSRKIPFGFRSSFALGRAGKSSLMSNRSAARSVPPSPLEIHTDLLQSEGPGSLSSSSPVSSAASKGLKPLRLSTVLNAKSISRSMFQSRMSTSSVNSFRQSGKFNRSSISSASVSSSNSISDNRLLSSARSSLIPLHVRTTLFPSESRTPAPSSPVFFNDLANIDEPRSAPVTSWQDSTNFYRPSSRLSEPFYDHDEDDEDDTDNYRNDTYDETIRRPISVVPHTAPVSRATSVLRQPMYAIATPLPTLMFAIASDDVEQVRQVLESGDAGPNDSVGPQSALAFTLTNDKLTNKLDIVKTLLAYGADPTVVKAESQPPRAAHIEGLDQQDAPNPAPTLMDEMDPATRYYVARADAAHTRQTSALIHRSFFRPLTRVRYELIGQDRALEQLFRVLSMHSRKLAVAPMVVMLCGPSGHGKSLLARKFGSLLDVPTHTVNMTTLRSTHDLWQSYSMSPYETPTTCTLAEFLINNEGKRCVVVLDEIEKTEDEKTLWSLLMPWELGRCAFEANSRHIDVRNVIWLGTSNIGHDLVFQHREARKNSEQLMSREEYLELMALLRPKVSERLGASILSRITTVLPFVPFTLDEKTAICSEALYNLGGETARSLSAEASQTIINTALAEYCEPEGARSLYRAVSSQLVDII
ncbi:hypothetical protein B0H34DRAFT_795315 [Crassisporium funariophilum]|nr:hypothetical protein B0H34DRAFT_795315 [Crassisporium funariophilum]